MATISTSGISALQVIKSEHLLRIINALNGVVSNDIKISGSLANGDSNTATNYSHAEGNLTLAVNNSHAEGSETIASGQYSHAEGYTFFGDSGDQFTQATGIGAHAEGRGTWAKGDGSHAEGASTGNGVDTDYILTASGSYSHAEGASTLSLGVYSHAEGYFTTTIGIASHAEGRQTTASADYSHAEGLSITGISGGSLRALGYGSHAEGYNTITYGTGSHAEGYFTIASGSYSHAEGGLTHTKGFASHAEGNSTSASGDYSHAEGLGTVALGTYQHVQGQFNISSSDTSAFIHGNGTSTSNRSNLIFASGSEVQVTGSLSVSGTLRVGPTTVLGAPTYGVTPQAILAFSSSTAGGGTLDLRNTSTDIAAGEFLGTIQFSGKDDQSVAYSMVQIRATANYAPNAGDSGGGNLKFYTSPGIGGNPPYERMAISASGLVNMTSGLVVTGSTTINNILTLVPTSSLPIGQPTGSFIVSGSGANCKPYFYNGTTWTALF